MVYVYCHILKKDGRKYVGITSQTPEERWRGGNGYKGSTHFKHAIDKYGWDAFDHVILEICQTREKAFEFEKYYIAKFNTTDEKCGFNLQSGGESPKQHWSSTKKTSEKQKGIKRTGDVLKRYQEHARKISKANIGVPRSEETKRKISESHKGMKYGEETKQKLRELLVFLFYVSSLIKYIHL